MTSDLIRATVSLIASPGTLTPSPVTLIAPPRKQIAAPSDLIRATFTLIAPPTTLTPSPVQLIDVARKVIALELHFRPVIFVIARCFVWSTLFVGVVLWFLPASMLATAGIRGPASFGAMQVAGLAMGLPGLALAFACVIAFAFVGRGTPAPFDPPRRLVVRGPYRVVRNPMYLGAWLYLVGFALFYRSMGVALYALTFLAVMHMFVVLYEEPTLRRTFGRDYETYCERVGRWGMRWSALGR